MSHSNHIIFTLILVLITKLVIAADVAPAAEAIDGDEPPNALVKASKIFSDRYISLTAAKASIDLLQTYSTRTLSETEYVDAVHKSSRFNATAIYVGPDATPPSEKATKNVFPPFKPKRDSWEDDEVYKKNELALLQEQASGNRVIGGGRAPQGSYQWCVAILDEDNATGCSGTLVASRLVLTARHCQTEMRGGPAKVYVGDTVGDQSGHIYGVKSTFHSPPNVGSAKPDLMLLELDNDVPGVNPRAVLPAGVTISNLAYVRIIGFGRDQPPDPNGYSRGRAGIKNVADVPLHGGSPAKLGYYPDFEFCAGIRGLNIDSCQGDSGGGAIVYIPELSRSFLYGAVSRSVRLQQGDTGRALCGNGGIYTRVDVFRDWLQQVAASVGVTLPQ